MCGIGATIGFPVGISCLCSSCMVKEHTAPLDELSEGSLAHGQARGDEDCLFREWYAQSGKPKPERNETNEQHEGGQQLEVVAFNANRATQNMVHALKRRGPDVQSVQQFTKVGSKRTHVVSGSCTCVSTNGRDDSKMKSSAREGGIHLSMVGAVLHMRGKDNSPTPQPLLGRCVLCGKRDDGGEVEIEE